MNIVVLKFHLALATPCPVIEIPKWPWPTTLCPRHLIVLRLAHARDGGGHLPRRTLEKVQMTVPTSPPNPFPVELSLTCPYSIIRTDSFHAAGYRVPAAACDYIYTLTALATSSAPPSLGHTRTRPLRARLAAPAPQRVALPPPHASPKCPGRTRRMPPCAANRRRDDHRSRYGSRIPFRPPKPKHYYQEEDASDHWSPVSTGRPTRDPTAVAPAPDAS